MKTVSPAFSGASDASVGVIHTFRFTAASSACVCIPAARSGSYLYAHASISLRTQAISQRSILPGNHVVLVHSLVLADDTWEPAKFIMFNENNPRF